MHRSKVVLNQKVNLKTKKTRGKADRVTIKKLPGISVTLNKPGAAPLPGPRNITTNTSGGHYV